MARTDTRRHETPAAPAAIAETPVAPGPDVRAPGAHASGRKSTVTAVWDRQSSGHRVANHIRGMIYRGELRPGDRVPQDDIAAALGCSRLPVREAIISLEREGLVTIEPHRGAFITPITPDMVRDQYELYGTTLGLALRRAVARGGASFLAELDDAHRSLAAAPDTTAFDRANDRFQSLVIEAAASPRLLAVLRVLSGFIPGNFFEVVPGSMDIQRAGAADVMAALGRGDIEGAVTACARMIREQADGVLALLHERGFFSDARP